MATNQSTTLLYELNRLASGGTAPNAVTGNFYDEQLAANIWAGTSGLGTLGALNAKAGTSGLGLNLVCNVLAGTSGLEARDALAARVS